MTARLLRNGSIAALALVCTIANADANLLRVLRTRKITPRSQAPQKIDWNRLDRAYKFSTKHGQSIQLSLGTASLVSTYACRDIAPVVMYTGELPNNYMARLKKTGEWIDEIMKPPSSEAEFRKKNYSRAYDLGDMHLQLSDAIDPQDLGWKDNTRAVINQQAFALVLYSFAWQPIETMLATKEIDINKDGKAISDWLYFWNVAGYAMGLDTRLLPTDVKQTKSLLAEIRGIQYRKNGEQPPAGVKKLLKGELGYLYAVVLQDKPVTAESKAQVQALLAQQIGTSKGLADALGLNPDPIKALAEIDGMTD